MNSIQKNSLLNILAAAQNSAKPLNEDDKKALKELERLCAEGLMKCGWSIVLPTKLQICGASRMSGLAR